MKLSAIIVSYNVKFYLEQCIRALLRAASNMEMEVLVVDNASTDDTATYLKDCFPKDWGSKIKFFENKINLGFGKANNQALKEASGEYILYINPDTLVSEESLSDCLT